MMLNVNVIFSCQNCRYSGLQRFTILCAALQVQNILKHLFPVPKDDSKRVMTFANMQDYISFRHHTYEQSAGIKSIALKVRGHLSHAGAQHCLSSHGLDATGGLMTTLEWLPHAYV